MYLNKYLVAVLCSFLCITLGHASVAEKRQLFLQAEKSLSSQNLREYFNYKQQLLDYPLIAYLEFNELLEGTPPRSQLEQFVQDYPLFPHRNLIIDSLLKIYKEEEDWHAIFDQTTEAQQPCLHLEAGYHLEKDFSYLSSLAEKIWLSGKNLDDECVEFLRASRFDFYNEPTLVWRRLVAAYERNNLRLVQQLAPYIAKEHQKAYNLWQTARRNKRRILVYANQMENQPHYNDVLAYVLTHYPQKRAAEGYSHYDRLAQRFSFNPKQQKNIVYYLGLHMTINGNRKALELMQQINPNLLNEEEHQWRARSSIKFQDWSSLLEFIADFPPHLRQQARWQFWEGYGLKKQGKYNRAIVLYRQAAKDRSFYGFYAAEEAGVKKSLNYKPSTPKEADSIVHSPAFLRYLELKRIGRDGQAISEWFSMLDKLNFDQLLFLANVAFVLDDYYLTFVTFTRARYWDDLLRRFPTPYRNLVESVAKENHMSPALIYAIMRTESSFRPAVRSHAGAVGLMQVLPSTGREIARKHKYKKRVNLTDPEVSLELGSYYMREILRRYHGNQVLAIASYNAGPNAVRDWLPQKKSLPAIEWIETVPYGETRDYIRSIFFAQVIFQWRLGERQISMRHFLRDINTYY